MKISYLSTFYPFRGGIAQFNAALYRALIAKGHEVDPITFKRQYPNLLFPGKTQYVTSDDKADIIPSQKMVDSIDPFNWITSAQKIRKMSPDILLMKFWIPYFAPSFGHISKHQKPNTRSIAILDNVIPHERKFFDMPLIKYYLNRVNGFIVMSEQVRDELLSIKPDARFAYKQHPLYDHFGAPEDKTIARQKLGLSANKKTLLFFGFIRAYKGLDLLIEAMNKLDDSYQLIIAGESYSSFEPYQKQIDQNRFRNNIHPNVRYISDKEVPLFFSAADACVLPYKSATQSGITSIAYHFELPMIATNVGGLEEMVKDNETGVVVDKPNADNLATGIQRFFKTDQSHFANQIRAKKKELSWEGFAQSILDLYKTIK
ncbi:MAG TPA: glycosyltransferase [Salinivirga sp.]|uniref:glycosyltransferase n=1 Tax=Salinivirga sp. TaxID=1970192 RepID=UPI002B465E77|nr:glycosyltransferase [Salinivirga sp.]HKK59865.1 glycosyltransferase [Salinivirga sp.]